LHGSILLAELTGNAQKISAAIPGMRRRSLSPSLHPPRQAEGIKHHPVGEVPKAIWAPILQSAVIDM
jgi:hypothetical protein